MWSDISFYVTPRLSFTDAFESGEWRRQETSSHSVSVTDEFICDFMLRFLTTVCSLRRRTAKEWELMQQLFILFRNINPKKEICKFVRHPAKFRQSVLKCINHCIEPHARFTPRATTGNILGGVHDFSISSIQTRIIIRRFTDPGLVSSRPLRTALLFAANIRRWLLQWCCRTTTWRSV